MHECLIVDQMWKPMRESWSRGASSQWKNTEKSMERDRAEGFTASWAGCCSWRMQCISQVMGLPSHETLQRTIRSIHERKNIFKIFARTERIKQIMMLHSRKNNLCFIFLPTISLWLWRVGSNKSREGGRGPCETAQADHTWFPIDRWPIETAPARGGD